jgi:ADP-heptose:LPS heptosyltransferase
MTDKYIIFHVDGGAGKNVIATAVCRSIKHAYPEHKLIVVTAYPEVYLHNPNIHRVYRFGNLPYFYDDFIKNKESKILRLEPYHTEDFLYRRKHLSEIWCDLFDIPTTGPQPELYPTQRELMGAHRFLQKKGPILLVQSSGGADNQQHQYSWARDIPPIVAQDIVDSVTDKFDKILHVRRDNQIELAKTIKVTDNLRNLFCYVALADKILGIDSLIQHVAAAFNKTATVCWIANSPEVFGYKLHKNILAKGHKNFTHQIDHYLDEADWIGNNFYQCSYSDLTKIFSKEEIIESLLGSKTELLYDIDVNKHTITI